MRHLIVLLVAAFTIITSYTLGMIGFSVLTSHGTLNGYVSCKDKCTVHSDPGGNIFEYMTIWAYFRSTGYNYRIDGQCGSACTILADWLSTSDQVCLTKKTEFWIHTGRISYGPYSGDSPVGWTEHLYTRRFREIIIGQNGLPEFDRPRKISNKMLRKVFKLC